MTVIKIIMRYLKGTKDYGLWYKKGGNFELKAFTDANWEEVLMIDREYVVENYFLVKD